MIFTSNIRNILLLFIQVYKIKHFCYICFYMYNKEYYHTHPELKDYHRLKMVAKREADRLFNYRLYCKEVEKIENYQEALNDNFIGWDLHHSLELTINGEPALSRNDLIRYNMYYNRPYFELIFLRHSEHSRMHHISKGNGHEFFEHFGIYPYQNRQLYNKERRWKYLHNKWRWE